MYHWNGIGQSEISSPQPAMPATLEPECALHNLALDQFHACHNRFLNSEIDIRDPILLEA